MPAEPHSWELVFRELSPAARAQVVKGMTPPNLVEALLAKDLFEDALVFTAHVLPAREVVWWGCLCAWRKVRPEPAPPERAAFQACLRWIQKPDEESRRAAQQAADVAGLGTPAGCLAMAVFLTKGSISEPGLPEVEASRDLTPATIVAALRLAAALEDPAHIDQCFRRYVLMAREPLRRLEAAASRKPAAAVVEGSIASRWVESETESPSPAPATPAAVRSAPPAPPPAPPPAAKTPLPREEPRRPTPKPTKKPETPKSTKGGDEDAWEGLSKLEE